MLDTDPERAFFSYKHVCKANEMGAVDKLMVTDELFRSSNIAERKRYVQLVESCRGKLSVNISVPAKCFVGDLPC